MACNNLFHFGTLSARYVDIGYCGVTHSYWNGTLFHIVELPSQNEIWILEVSFTKLST
jgi:hypothetical protein